MKKPKYPLPPRPWRLDYRPVGNVWCIHDAEGHQITVLHQYSLPKVEGRKHMHGGDIGRLIVKVVNAMKEKD